MGVHVEQAGHDEQTGIVDHRRVRARQRRRGRGAGIDNRAIIADDQRPVLVLFVLVAGKEAAAVHMLGHGRSPLTYPPSLLLGIPLRGA